MPRTSSTVKITKDKGERNTEKSLNRVGESKRLEMTAFGSKIWAIICKDCGARGILHPLEHYAENVVFLTARQFRTRFDSDKHWAIEEIRRVYAETNSEELLEVLNDFIRRKQ